MDFVVRLFVNCYLQGEEWTFNLNFQANMDQKSLKCSEKLFHDHKATLYAEEDFLIHLKAPDLSLNGPCGEIVLPTVQWVFLFKHFGV